MRVFFFRVKSSARIFFSDKYCFFLNSEISIHYLCIHALYIFLLSQQIKGYRPLFNARFFRKCNTVRQEKATWSGQLSCAFFQSLPSGISLSQPIIMMSYSIHQNSLSLVPSTPKCQSKKKYLFNKSEILNDS